MSFRREIFEAVGAFTHGIGRVGKRPVGCEETEFCIRAQTRFPEGVILYEPTARVRHRVPAARADWAYFRARCYAEGLSKALVTQVAGPRPRPGLRADLHDADAARRGSCAASATPCAATSPASRGPPTSSPASS